jgi:hypothetical protein
MMNDLRRPQKYSGRLSLHHHWTIRQQKEKLAPFTSTFNKLHSRIDRELFFFLLALFIDGSRHHLSLFLSST